MVKVAAGAEETGTAAADVLTATQELSEQARELKAEVEKFLTTVRAA